MKQQSITNTAQSQHDADFQSMLIGNGEIPAHIAIIMDGNGRWAKNNGRIRLLGHRAGVESVRDITEACAQIGVKYLTLYAFSTENWGRPTTEIKGLFRILVSSLRREAGVLHKNDVKLTTIGQMERFPKQCQKELQEAMELTKNNSRLELCLALSYSGRWDITEAMKKIGSKVKTGEIELDQINDCVISQHLATAAVPDPDLIIRTSGEYRISNFLLWQLAYSELHITDTYWPDFRREELYKAIESFQKRDRRFGKLSDPKNKTAMAHVAVNNLKKF